MAIKVLIPTPLRQYTDKKDAVEVNGRTVEELMKNLMSKYPQLERHLYAEDGKLRSFVNVYVNDEDIRYLQQEHTPVKSIDVISIVPSIAGGVEINDRAFVGEVRLSNEEIQRYSRHLIMPEVGIDGQKKLKASRVLIVGAGGLGSPLALYLTAAGVGSLGIVDVDVIDVTNLQRQILYSTDDIGRSKLDVARERLRRINPHVEIEPYEKRLTADNALEVLRDFDIIVDGTDNFPTRYLVNDACVLLGKPNVYGSIFRFEGQVTVFDAKRGPCYRCLYPTPPPPGLVPSCAEGGVLGVLPGIIGSLQALETIKLIIGRGNSLVERLILFDALTLKFRELKLRKNPECPICGEHPSIHELIDYEQFCGIQTQPLNSQNDQQSKISPEELKARLDRGDDLFILDVREPHEYQVCNLGGYLVPINDLQQRIHELDPSREIVVHCKMGGRSAKAVEVLKRAGFQNVKDLIGGIDAWATRIDNTMPRY
ncbi:MAG: molybdopterin-synthase adenylyltransferase MoeB [Ignavibacteria bacterium]|nr:molybdopterin-synthase adenylyltransferase MoeB [Ignavibacteria bacterium]MBI3764920.1 molybdopterin-synthase adenylyltransferase MoeB [Ignavibacteriales bacterium]